MSFAYDNDDLLTQAGSLSISNDINSGMINATTLGVVTTNRLYNGFGEITQYEVLNSTNPQIRWNYTHDKLGRITSKSETVSGITSTEEYQYNLAGQLIQARKNGVVTHWEYDANGNRTKENGTAIATYDDQDRLVRFDNYVFAYNANGELISKTNTTTQQVTQYNYGALGNLLSVTLTDGTNIEYILDGSNRRIGKKINGNLIQGLLYKDQLNPIAELDADNNVIARFVYGTKSNVPDYMVKGGSTYRIISNHLGSPQLVVNVTDGTIAQQIEYDVWGSIIYDSNPGFQPFGFAGGIYDQQTKLTRFGARDYDAQIGRWTSKDPIRFNGEDSNIYAYVFNDPVNYIDPNGLWSVGGLSPTGVAGGFISAAGLGLTTLTAPAWAFPVGIGMIVTGGVLVVYDFVDTLTTAIDDVHKVQDGTNKDLEYLKQQLDKLDGYKNTKNCP